MKIIPPDDDIREIDYDRLLNRLIVAIEANNNNEVQDLLAVRPAMLLETEGFSEKRNAKTTPLLSAVLVMTKRENSLDNADLEIIRCLQEHKTGALSTFTIPGEKHPRRIIEEWIGSVADKSMSEEQRLEKLNEIMPLPF